METNTNTQLRTEENLFHTEENTTLESSKLTLKDLLVASLGTKRKSRVSTSNSKCAKAFQHNKKTYFDCTLDRAPDGQIPTKEWCYLEKNPNSDKVWDFCKPDMNYDKIRSKIQELIKSLTTNTRKIQSECDKLDPEENSMIGEYKSTVDVQTDLSNKIGGIYKETLAAKNAIEHLNSLSKEWEDLEKKSVEYAQQIEKQEEKIKILKDEAKGKKEQEEKAEVKSKKYSKDQIKMESEMSKVEIADWIQDKEPALTKDCSGMLNYEEEPEGTGLVGRYFNNPTFSGAFKTRVDPVINLEFTGSNPIDGVNPNTFSIQWDGFVQAPFRSTFYFSIETEGGAEVYLSGRQIISHRMYTASTETKDRGTKLLQESIKVRNDPSNNNFNKKTSLGINLAQGDKYIIRVKYYHSVHDFMDEDIRTYIKLTWYSDEMEEELVGTRFLFPENNFPAFKISGISPEVGVIRKLDENDLAFKDSKTFILQDIPAEYRGNPSLKLPNNYRLDSIEFFTNIPINVFIARLEHYQRPFPSNFENMNQFLSLLEVPEPDEKNKDKLSFEASSSSLMRIYKKKFEAGKITIPLTKTGLGVKGLPLVLFFGVDSSNNSPIACGGDLYWISQPGSEHFESCKESSKLNASYGCEAGLSSSMTDAKGSIWASNNEGVGAYLTVNFKGFYEVQKVSFKDRSNPGEQNSKLLFEFSTGESFLYHHVHNSIEDTIEFPTSYRTYWVKVTIKGVYGTINNGGAFKYYGTKCKPQISAEEGKNELVVKPLFNTEANKVYNMGCLDSVSNSKKLFNVNKSVGYCTTINCFDSCSDNLEADIYGSDNYSKDSAICKSAVHSGVLSSTGGKLLLCFGARSFNLPALKKNGIQSKAKLETDLTINFKPIIVKERIEIEAGTKFDLKDIFFRTWQPAVITEIVRVPIIGTKLAKYKVEGKNSSINLPAIPIKGNPFVAVCGKKVKGRDCRGTKLEEVPKINIRFGPKTYNSKGDYKLDYGNVFGFKGQPYGWSRDMKSNMKSVNMKKKVSWENYGNIIESYVEFPPSKKSKYCASPVVVCDKVNYTIKTGDGSFNVRIFIDIQDANSQVDFKVNGKVFAQNRAIPKGTRVTLEGVVEAINESIEINSDCSDHCFYSMGRINMIQVFPFQENKDKEEPVPVDEGEICNKKVKRGKNCESGEGDLLHCVFQGEKTIGASKCTGQYIKTKFPLKYEKCPLVAGLEYCIKKKYSSQIECSEYCPGRCEKSGVCLGK